MKYEISITGDGTKEELINHLKQIVQDIESLDESDEIIEEWENPCLFTSIKTLAD